LFLHRFSFVSAAFLAESSTTATTASTMLVSPVVIALLTSLAWLAAFQGLGFFTGVSGALAAALAFVN